MSLKAHREPTIRERLLFNITRSLSLSFFLLSSFSLIFDTYIFSFPLKGWLPTIIQSASLLSRYPLSRLRTNSFGHVEQRNRSSKRYTERSALDRLRYISTIYLYYVQGAKILKSKGTCLLSAWKSFVNFRNFLEWNSTRKVKWRSNCLNSTDLAHSSCKWDFTREISESKRYEW